MRHLSAKEEQDDVIAELATVQWGVVTSAQLRGIGLDKSAVRRRVRAGRLHPVHRGVYAVGHRRLAWEGRWLAAVLAAGDAAVLSHAAAAALWGLLEPADGPVEVTVPASSGRRSRPGVVVHRFDAPSEAVVRRGIPVTTPARTLRDLCGRLADWRFHRAVNQAESDGLVTREEAGELFPGVADGSRSGLERRFLAICRRHGIRLPRLNVVVGGRLVDAHWPGTRVVVEIDSARYHDTRTAFHRDRRRGNDVALAGYLVLRFTDADLRDGPAVAAAVKRAIGLHLGA